jgi:hypothetical protein
VKTNECGRERTAGESVGLRSAQRRVGFLDGAPGLLAAEGDGPGATDALLLASIVDGKALGSRFRFNAPEVPEDVVAEDRNDIVRPFLQFFFFPKKNNNIF